MSGQAPPPPPHFVPPPIPSVPVPGQFRTPQFPHPINGFPPPMPYGAPHMPYAPPFIGMMPPQGPISFPRPPPLPTPPTSSSNNSAPIPPSPSSASSSSSSSSSSPSSAPASALSANAVVIASAAPKLVSAPIPPPTPAPAPAPVPPAAPPKPTIVLADDSVMNVFVGKIPEIADDALIRQLLDVCGTVVSWKRMVDAKGVPKAFGFVDFKGPDAAARAIRCLNGYSIEGNALLIKVDEKNQAALDAYLTARQERLKEEAEKNKESGEIGEDLSLNSEAEQAKLTSAFEAVLAADPKIAKQRQIDAERLRNERKKQEREDRERQREREREIERERERLRQVEREQREREREAEREREWERQREREKRKRQREEEEEAAMAQAAAEERERARMRHAQPSPPSSGSVSYAHHPSHAAAAAATASALSIMDAIPTDVNVLFSLPIDWNLVLNAPILPRLREWISKKVVEYLGASEESFVDTIIGKLFTRTTPFALCSMLQPVLDHETVSFVSKLWRVIVFETARMSSNKSS